MSAAFRSYSFPTGQPRSKRNCRARDQLDTERQQHYVKTNQKNGWKASSGASRSLCPARHGPPDKPEPVSYPDGSPAGDVHDLSPVSGESVRKDRINLLFPFLPCLPSSAIHYCYFLDYSRQLLSAPVLLRVALFVFD